MEKEENINTTENKKEDNLAKQEVPNTEDKNETNTETKSEITPDQKILELEDKLARTFAEMENQRRRYDKEKEDAYEYGGFAFAKEALSLIDNLERSKQILQNDETLKDSDALKKILNHIEIINKDLISIFTKNNIKPIESLGKKLDPNFHQAMMEVEDENKEVGTIVQEIQKGFTIKDRLLRPSLVGVSKKPSNKDEKNEKNKENQENK